jgi:hypothetical protein
VCFHLILLILLVLIASEPLRQISDTDLDAIEDQGGLASVSLLSYLLPLAIIWHSTSARTRKVQGSTTATKCTQM